MDGMIELILADPFGTGAMLGVVVTALGVWRTQAVLKNDIKHLQANVELIMKALLGPDEQ